jgi:hypothetical protein
VEIEFLFNYGSAWESFIDFSLNSIAPVKKGRMDFDLEVVLLCISRDSNNLSIGTTGINNLVISYRDQIKQLKLIFMLMLKTFLFLGDFSAEDASLPHPELFASPRL